MPYQRWTPQRKKQAADLYLAGASIEQVAVSLMTSSRHVKNALISEGGPIKPRSAYRASYVRAAANRPAPVPKIWTAQRLEELRKLHAQGLHQKQIAKIFGTSQGKVSFHGRKLGLHWVADNSGEKNPAWKGGRRLDKTGYVMIRKPQHPNARAGYVREHRLVMEQKLGRLLLQKEVVHHKKRHDHSNNDPDNLELYASNGEHLHHELAGKCPNWTEDGRRRILEGTRRKRIRSQSKTDASVSL
jgi:hypothetical protein